MARTKQTARKSTEGIGKVPNKSIRTEMEDEDDGKAKGLLVGDPGEYNKPTMEIETATEETTTKLPSPAKTDKVVEFNVIAGSSKYNAHDRVCLLVPTNMSTPVLEALENSDKKSHDWTIDGSDDDGDDGTIVKDIQTLPSSMFQPIRTIAVEELAEFIREGKADENQRGNKKSEDGNKKSTKTRKHWESEILDWLIHGEDYFSVKYVVLEFVHQEGDYTSDIRDYTSDKILFQITKQEHSNFYAYAKSLSKICNEVDWVYLGICDLIDSERASFLKHFMKECGDKLRVVTVDENIFANVHDAAENKGEDWVLSLFGDFVGCMW